MINKFKVCAGKNIFRDEENLDTIDEDIPDFDKEPRTKGDKG